MKNLPAALILEKNKIASSNPFLVTLDITLTDNTKFYLVNNTEDITFNSQVYTAVPFQVEPTKQSGTGEIPTVSLRVSNVTRLMQGYLEATSGGVDSTVLIRVVNAALLAENYSELEMTFNILTTETDAYWVTFTLGMPNPLRKRFPLYRYIAEHCNWQFNTGSNNARECNYAGWKANTAYNSTTPHYVIETATDSTQHRYKCTTSGTSGATEPATWPTSGTVADGTVVWTEDGTQLCKRTLDDCRGLQNTERFGGFPGMGGGNVRFA